jgi:replication initiation and membrane attachment protein
MSPDYPSSYLATINEIYSRIDLPRGVLNCMICKVLRDKNGELPGIKYFEKVAESWISDNVLTTNDAIKYVTTLKESKNSYSTKSSVKNNPIDQDNGGFRSL